MTLPGAYKAGDVRVTIGGMATVTFSLHAGLSEEMTVTAKAPLLDLTSNQVSTNYDSELLEELPTQVLGIGASAEFGNMTPERVQ